MRLDILTDLLAKLFGFGRAADAIETALANTPPEEGGQPEDVPPEVAMGPPDPLPSEDAGQPEDVPPEVAMGPPESAPPLFVAGLPLIRVEDFPGDFDEMPEEAEDVLDSIF